MSEALLALEGDRGPKLKELLLQPFGRSVAAGFSRQTLGISPTKMGINGGLMGFNQQNGGFNGIYTLVMTNIAMENDGPNQNR